jgi:hypothetical protein
MHVDGSKEIERVVGFTWGGEDEADFSSLNIRVIRKNISSFDNVVGLVVFPCLSFAKQDIQAIINCKCSK